MAAAAQAPLQAQIRIRTSEFSLPYFRSHAKVTPMILDCNEIIQNRLWVGSFVRPEDVKTLKQMEITGILSLQSDQDVTHYSVSQKKLLRAYALAEIELRRIPTADFDKEALAANLPRAVEELEKALAPLWAKIYVHCTAGINRGPTLAAAYLIKCHHLSAREAYDYVTTRRHCSPYLSTLEEYEASLGNA
jgi:protein-tyrosine phosphatase